jgi:hypothetical protein
MANPVKGEVSLEVGGKTYMLVLGTYALAALERRKQMPWPQLIKRVGEGQAGYDDILAMFHCGLLRHHRQITEEQAADMIDAVGIETAVKVIGEALKLSMPQGDGDGPASENPTKPGNGHGMISSPTG